jgi:hypothetical protein
MTAVAVPFVELMRAAHAGFVETHAATEGEGSKASGDVLTYALNSAVTAAERLVVLARRFSGTPEARTALQGERPTSAPVITDRAFRDAAEDTAKAIEACGALLGTVGKRMAATLRSWVSSGDATYALTLGSQAETAARLLKRKAFR